MFKVIGESGSIWYYDVLNNKVLDSNGTQLNLFHIVSNRAIALFDDRKYQKFFDQRGLNNALKPNDRLFIQTDQLTDLIIQLGLKCDLNCIYCCQEICSPDTTSRINLEKFLTQLRKSTINFSNLRVIQLWGGEPLVYWKFVKRIVEFIRENIPEFKGYFHLTTNATLLNKEKIEFFIKNNVRVQVSHDGVNHKFQRTINDWLDDDKKVELIKYFLGEKHMGDVNITFAPMFNPNIFDSLELFEKRIPGVKICCRSPLRCDSTNAHLMKMFSAKNVEIAKTSFYKLLTLQPGERFYKMTQPTRSRLLDLCCNLISGRLPAEIQFNCPSKQKYEICFNLQGQHIFCHGATASMGVAHGTIDNIANCFITKAESVAYRTMCKECLYTQFCQGPCVLYQNKDAKIHCESTHWFWEAWFAAIWKTIFNEKPIEVLRV